MRTVAALTLIALWILPGTSEAGWCNIYVHGHNSSGADTGDRMDYFVDGSRNFVTASSANPGGGSDQYWIMSDAGGSYNSKDHQWWYWACEVLKDVDDATSGRADAGGRTCAAGSTYRVFGHSEGSSIAAYLLGNTETSDPDYSWLNTTCGRDPALMKRISHVDSLGGCPNCNGADAACNGGYCSLIANFAGGVCGTGTSSLRTNADRFSDWMKMPTRTVWLMGSADAGFDGGCISDPNDLIVSFGSSFFCSWAAPFNGGNWDVNDRTTARQSVCTRSEKMVPARSDGLYRLRNDYDHEMDHDEMRDDTGDCFMCDWDARTVKDTWWMCGGSPCTGDQIIADDSAKRTGWYYSNYK